MKDFTAKHKILSPYADNGAINYVVRWNVKVSGVVNKLILYYFPAYIYNV